MPARSRTLGDAVSKIVSANVRRYRRSLGWSMPELSRQMDLNGDTLSAAVINLVENGVTAFSTATDSYRHRSRIVSVEELDAFARVFEVSAESLMEEK